MNDGSKFGTIKKFTKKDFFDKNKTGTIYLSDRNLSLEIFAYLKVKSDDSMIYNTVNAREERITKYLEYVRDNATYFRNIELKDGDHIVTLSTCSSDDSVRAILLAKIV